MPVPTTIADLDAVAGNNSPVGTDPIGTSLDDYLRAHASIIRQVSDNAAALAGSASQVFSVASATSAAHAARLDQISLFPTVASATSPDIFGAAGATIDYTGTTTATSIANCTAAQAGSVKRIITAAAAPFTASASMTIDGATSGTTTYPAGAQLDVMATSTSTFAIRTVFAHGSGSCAVTSGSGAFTTVSGAYEYTRIGREITMRVKVTITLNGSAATSVLVTSPIANGGATYVNAVGQETAIVGVLLIAQMAPSSTTIGITKLLDFSYVGGDGYILDINLNLRA